MNTDSIKFSELFKVPLRSGVTRNTQDRGKGTLMVNMKEMFAHNRLNDVNMDRCLINETESRFLLEPYDLLFARRSLVLDGAGKCSVFIASSEQVTFEGSILRVRLDDSIADPLFYYYYFTSPTGIANIRTIVEQCAASGIRGSDLANLLVPCPPLETQKEIAHILGTLDDKIELNRRMNKTLEEIAQALFKHWFIDFEFPYAEGKPYKSSGGAMIDSELGPIPHGWKVGKLADIIELLDYKRIPLNSQERKKRHGKYPYYGATGILDYVDDYLLEGIHLLVGEDGTVQTGDGKPSLQYVWDKFWVSNHAHILTGKGKVTVEYLYLLLNTIVIGPYITGAVQPKLSQQNLNSIPCLIVPDLFLDKYSAVGVPLFKKGISNKEITTVLESLKKKTQNRLFDFES